MTIIFESLLVGRLLFHAKEIISPSSVILIRLYIYLRTAHASDGPAVRPTEFQWSLPFRPTKPGEAPLGIFLSFVDAHAVRASRHEVHVEEREVFFPFRPFCKGEKKKYTVKSDLCRTVLVILKGGLTGVLGTLSKRGSQRREARKIFLRNPRTLLSTSLVTSLVTVYVYIFAEIRFTSASPPERNDGR